jgi:hypothetical protein
MILTYGTGAMTGRFRVVFDYLANSNRSLARTIQVLLYIPRSVFHLAWLLNVRPETFGPYYIDVVKLSL